LIKIRPTVFIITGKTGSGKTTFLVQLIKRLRKQGLTVTGFLAVKSVTKEPDLEYDIHLLDSGKSIPLASREPVKGWIKISSFYFNPETILRGNRILNDPQISDKDLVVVDEIGIFEMEGKVWADSVSLLVSKSDTYMIWVVRDTILEKVIRKWDLQDPVILDIKKVSIGQAEKRILSMF
jgi:nucleoside-triphosphatase THEP1